MKKLIALVIALALTLTLTAALADTITIAVPNDPTNEGRALLLLQSQGVLTLKEGSGLEATKGDIESSVVDIELVEVEAALVPEIKQDVDYAIFPYCGLQSCATARHIVGAVVGVDAMALTLVAACGQWQIGFLISSLSLGIEHRLALEHEIA